MHRSNAGFSLIEVLLVAGITSAIALVIAQLTSDQLRASRNIQAVGEANYLSNDIKETLIDVNSCGRSFGALGGAPLRVNQANVVTNIVKDESGTPVVAYRVGDVYGNGTLRIRAMTFGPSTYAGAHPSTTSFETPLKITYEKVGVDLGGSTLPPRTLTIRTRTDGAGRVATCSSSTLGTFIAEDIDENGFIQYPNGLMIQWGRATALNNTTTTINFNRPFPNRVFSISVGGTRDNGDNEKDNWPELYRHPAETTLTTFKVHSSNNANDPISWMAIGD